MLNEEKELRSGIFIYNSEQKQLELFDLPLQRGRLIEVRVFHHWLPGHLQQDDRGWYLLTFDYVEIRLRSGLRARYRDPFLCFRTR